MGLLGKSDFGIVGGLLALAALGGVLWGQVSNMRAHERSRLVSAVTERVDSNKDGVLDPNEIGRFYSVFGRLDYNELTNNDLRLYLKRTDPNKQ